MVADEPFGEINTIRGILNDLDTKENILHIVYNNTNIYLILN